MVHLVAEVVLMTPVHNLVEQIIEMVQVILLQTKDILVEQHYLAVLRIMLAAVVVVLVDRAHSLIPDPPMHIVMAVQDYQIILMATIIGMQEAVVAPVIQKKVELEEKVAVVEEIVARRIPPFPTHRVVVVLEVMVKMAVQIPGVLMVLVKMLEKVAQIPVVAEVEFRKEHHILQPHQPQVMMLDMEGLVLSSFVTQPK